LALNNEERTFIKGLVKDKPTIYLAKIQQDLLNQHGIHISTQTISNELHKRFNWTQKTMRKVHPNCDPDDRMAYISLIGRYDPECLVFTGKFFLCFLFTGC
jgi:hypothetical protein